MWSMGREDKIGKWIASETLNTELLIIDDPNQATLIPKLQNTPGSPDISIISLNLIHKTTWTILEDALGSDHLPTSISIANKKYNPTTNRTKLNTNKLNWDKFKLDMKIETDNTEFNNNDPIASYNKLPELILNILIKNGAKI